MLKDIFSRKKPIIAMLHVFAGSEKEQTERALEDLDKLNPFVDGVIVENYGWGYRNSNLAERETRKRIGEITSRVIENTHLPVGVNLLPNDYEGAICIASSTKAKFIQLDHVTGEFIGCEPVDAEKFLKFRKLFSEVAVLGGIHPKYYTLANALTPIWESAQKAKLLADVIVVTGKYTGGETSLKDVQLAKTAVEKHPVFIGSGLNAMNVKTQLSLADGAIVGTAFKKKGVVPGEPIDEDMVKRFIARVEEVRNYKGAAP